ncbi:hypothetical protein VKS41_008501 [Umbelopsis sp. WA50703]|jgi:hypothetical protein
MSEVRLGGDSSDSVTEMGDPETTRNNRTYNSADSTSTKTYKADQNLEEHLSLASNGLEQADKSQISEANTAICITTDTSADSNDAPEEKSTENSTNSVKVHARQLFIGNVR